MMEKPSKPEEFVDSGMKYTKEMMAYVISRMEKKLPVEPFEIKKDELQSFLDEIKAMSGVSLTPEDVIEKDFRHVGVQVIVV